MNTKKFLLSIVSLFFIMTTAVAQEVMEAPAVKAEMICASDFVKLQKENKNLVVIDAAKAKLYDQSHIEGAINLPYAKFNVNEPVYGLLQSPEAVAKILGENGISNEDEIVVYDEGSQKYSTRVYWVLKYLGAENVKLLHKNMSTFRKARVKLTSAKPKVTPKTFTVNLNPDIFADTAFVESMIGNPDVIIIDARKPEEFNGTGTGNNEYSEGHIEGAVNIPYESTIKGNDKVFISPEEFKALAPDVAFSPEKTYIVYCKTGVKGATMYAYLHNVMGYPNVKMYEGSYLQWAADGKPVVK